jgi:hypothetical protein
VNAIASSYPLAAVSVDGLPWIEMDFPEDYRRAREVIYPAMLQNLPPERVPVGRRSEAGDTSSRSAEGGEP